MPVKSFQFLFIKPVDYLQFVQYLYILHCDPLLFFCFLIDSGSYLVAALLPLFCTLSGTEKETYGEKPPFYCFFPCKTGFPFAFPEPVRPKNG
jgi:hypothetical protein